MEELIQYLIPVVALAALAGGWAAMQLLAKSMKVKNHIDNPSGCCGACGDKASCTSDPAASQASRT